MKRIRSFFVNLIYHTRRKRIETPNLDAENYEFDNFDINKQSIKDLNLALKYGKPSNRIGKWESANFIELPFGLIKKELPLLQKKELLSESIELVMQNQFKDFKIKKASANEIISFLLWIKSQQEFIHKIEEENLQSDPEPEMLASGINRLNEFGIAPLVEKIAKDWNMKPDEVEDKPYFKIYEKMKMDKVQSEINKAYQKIIEEKSKRKR